MLTDRLKELFSSLKEKEINEAVARSPFLNDPNGSRTRQFFIDETIQLISTEIERLCSSYNPSDLLTDFVDIIVYTHFPRKSIRAGQTFYRARIGHQELQGAVDDCNINFILPYHGKDIGKPPALRTSGGRFNRAGQSFLYLSSNVETAIAEVHLQVGQECSVGEFRCTQDVDLVDLSGEGFNTSFKAVEDHLETTAGTTAGAVGTATDATKAEAAYLAAIAEEKEIVKFWRDFLLQPMYSETRYKYLLTQFITDAFLKADVHGLFFNSTQASGDNIVCFYDDKFKLMKFSERLWRADKIEYKISTVKDAVRKWYLSPDYRAINSFNEDESEKRDAEIDYFLEWIEYEREEQGVTDTKQAVQSTQWDNKAAFEKIESERK